MMTTTTRVDLDPLRSPQLPAPQAADRLLSWRSRRPPAGDYDVVVVGARCAGAATAMLLARAGLSVLCVDRARNGTDTLSTHALTPPGVLQLSRWGLLDQVRNAGTPTVTRVVYHYANDVVDIPVRIRGDVDGLYAPRRHVLDRIMADAAAEAGADVRHGVDVRGLLIDRGRVVGATLRSGRGALTQVRARMVIGADGARSTVARLTGAEARYVAPHSSATIYTYADDLPLDAYHNYFRNGVAAGSIPTNGGQANLWVGLPAHLLRHGHRGDIAGMFTDTLTRAAPQVAARISRATRRQYATFTGARGFLRRSWGPGWALVGDAVYFKDPVSAHGMTDALIGAEVLVRQVLQIAAGAEERVALADYDRRRRQLIDPMIPAIEDAASFSWDTPSLQRAHRQMSSAMRAEWEYLAPLGPLPMMSTNGHGWHRGTAGHGRREPAAVDEYPRRPVRDPT